jgi:hypothetical protein
VLVIGVVIALITGGGFAGAGAFFRADSSSLGAYFAPARIVMIVVWGAASGLLWPLTLMPPAEIYRELTQGQGDA